MTFNKGHKSWVRFDPQISEFHPITSIGFEYIINNIIHSTILVSTRESLHVPLSKVNNRFLRNKIYFFHCTASLVDKIFPGCIDYLNKSGVINKVAFVSCANKVAYSEKCRLKYDSSAVVGNCLESIRMINRDEIIKLEKKTNINVLISCV